ncbi:type II CAAX endopeptidase family protein [Dactylosporangium sp. AC04546]|uniref:CPBP family intramembrane glutamic endopeptidase n=1 Tax=Dactylosporangium sp. AC04546 TaxID=2862460 RepID=UPI001EDF33CA|nr:type II CAAX endopeptidase family protein [Dactylosporangium sp. AC04546]WVK79775.1 type II CAAX endopeptidase family protein [Dactylosporangium sp. AC04546]
MQRIGLRRLGLLVVFAIVLVVSALLNSAASGNPVTALAVGLLTATGGILLYRLLVRRLEHREADELSPATLLPGVLRGTAAGIGLFTVTIALIAAVGGYRITGWGSLSAAIATLGTMIGAAVAEELLFRAVLFRLLQAWAGTAVALSVSGVLFGALHLLNPAATLWGALAIAAEAGVMLGAAYTATRALWLPIGLHLGWNFAESGLFGTVVSGTTGTHGLLRSVTEGPAFLSGGAFGPEGSIFAILVGGVTAALLLRHAHIHGRIVPARRAAR